MVLRRTRALGRTAAHTAVIVGTANAVNGRALRRHHDEALQRQAQAQQAAAAQQQAPAAPQAAATAGDPIAQLERLAALHASGALSDEEFATLKRRALE